MEASSLGVCLRSDAPCVRRKKPSPQSVRPRCAQRKFAGGLNAAAKLGTACSAVLEYSAFTQTPGVDLLTTSCSLLLSGQWRGVRPPFPFGCSTPLVSMSGLNPLQLLKTAVWRASFALRESGQALERVGCRLQGIYSHEEIGAGRSVVVCACLIWPYCSCQSTVRHCLQ